MILSSLYVHAADGTRLHVRHSPGVSRGRACLLIHGSGDGQYVWSRVCKLLEPRVPVVLVDLRGHGDSEPSRSGQYDTETHVDDVLGIIGTLGLGSLVVVGHSLGGRIAIHLAAKHAGVTGACIIDTCPEPNAAASARASLILRESLRTYRSREEYQTTLMEMRPLISAEMARELAVAALKPSPQGFELKVDPDFVRRGCEPDEATTPEQWRQLLRAISCPTLIVRGGASAMVTATDAIEMTGLLRHGQLVTIASAGHAVMSDNPSEFQRVLMEFMSDRMRQAPGKESIPLHVN